MYSPLELGQNNIMLHLISTVLNPKEFLNCMEGSKVIIMYIGALQMVEFFLNEESMEECLLPAGLSY